MNIHVCSPPWWVQTYSKAFWVEIIGEILISSCRFQHVLSHVPWTQIEDLTRWYLHPSSWLGHHCWEVEGHAPWAQNQRSNWAQNPESWAASRLFSHGGWCSGSVQNRVVGGWSRSNSHLQKKRSGSCNWSWRPYSGALSLEHPSRFENNFRECFPRLH